MSHGLRREAALACTRDFQSSAVAGLAKELATALTVGQVAEVVRRHLSPLLQADIVLALSDKAGRVSYLGEEGPDIEVAQWSFDHRQEAGLGTMTLSAAGERTVPLMTRARCWAVMALRPTGALSLDNPDTRRLALVQSEAEKIRATLLGAVSRDISLPVQSILNTTEKLLPRAAETGLSAAVSSIRGQVEVLRRLNGNLKEMARLQAGNARLDMAPVSVSELISDAAGRLWEIETDKTIQTDVGKGLPLVTADRALMLRAIENLIDNAEKYTPKGTPVEISARPLDDGVEIVVRDHGRGIPEGEKMLDEAARRSRPGLGFALVRVIVQAHRGRMTIGNMKDGGAAVKLWLPAADGNAREPSEEKASPESRR